NDVDGNMVHSLPPRTVTLAPGAQHMVSESWNTGLLLAGNYRLHAVLGNAAGVELDESDVSFSIRPNAAGEPLASLRLVTDSTVYHVDDRVRFELLARNLSVNTLVEVSQVRLSVSDSDGAVVFDQTLPVPQLAPGNQAGDVLEQVLTA